MTLPEDFDVGDFVSRVLAEDLGSGGDVTSKATIPPDARLTAEMNARQAITVAGLDIVTEFFRRLDPKIEIEQPVTDGDRVSHGTTIMRLAGIRDEPPSRFALLLTGRAPATRARPAGDRRATWRLYGARPAWLLAASSRRRSR